MCLECSCLFVGLVGKETQGKWLLPAAHYQCSGPLTRQPRHGAIRCTHEHLATVIVALAGRRRTMGFWFVSPAWGICVDARTTGTLSRLPTQCHWPSRWGLVPLSRHCVVWGAHYQSGKCQPERPRGSGAHCCSNQRGVEPKRNISQSSLSSSLFPDGGFVF